MPLKQNVKRRRHIMLVSEEIHQTLFQIAEVGELTPGEVLETLFEANDMDSAIYILKVIRADFNPALNYKNLNIQMWKL